MNIMTKLFPAHAAIAAELEQAGFGNGPAQANSRQRLECAGVPSSVSQPALSHPVSQPSTPNHQPLLGVTAVIRDARGRILLGRKARACSPDLVGKWVTPGGRVNHGETIEHAITREAFEETALIVRISGLYPPLELITAANHFVFAVFECRLGFGILPEHARAGDDLSELRWCALSDLHALVPDLTPLTIRALNNLHFHLNLGTHEFPIRENL